MRTTPSMLRTTLALSFVLLLTPGASNAQVTANDCTAGSGLYSCEFKHKEGDIQIGSLELSFNRTSSLGSFFVDVEGEQFFGSCACGLKGSLDDDKPLTNNKNFLCAGQERFVVPVKGFSDVVLAGKIIGNPTRPPGLGATGQLQQLFNTASNSTVSSSTGYLFDCVAQGNFTIQP